MSDDWVNKTLNDKMGADSFSDVRTSTKEIFEKLLAAGYDYDEARAWLLGMLGMLQTEYMYPLWAIWMADVYGVDRPDLDEDE